MKFSWKALLCAPLPVPLLAAGVSLISPPDPVCGFPCVFVQATACSYGATILLGLPGFYLLSKIAPLTLPRTCLLGAVLGTISYAPLVLFFWLALSRHGNSFADVFAYAMPGTLIFSVAGLVTAAAYWFLAGAPAARSTGAPRCG